ncbi:unnamed protein product [Trichobilharzia regenti]|nr:unnamed protein product [Trichobilharzia regenti]
MHLEDNIDSRYYDEGTYLNNFHILLYNHFCLYTKRLAGEMNSDPLKSSEKKATVYHTDMSQQMQDEIINICLKFWKICQRSLDTTSFIKRTLDKKYGTAWHCIIGDEYNRWV